MRTIPGCICIRTGRERDISSGRKGGWGTYLVHVFAELSLGWGISINLAPREVGLANNLAGRADVSSLIGSNLLVEGKEMDPYMEAWSDCEIEVCALDVLTDHEQARICRHYDVAFTWWY